MEYKEISRTIDQNGNVEITYLKNGEKIVESFSSKKALKNINVDSEADPELRSGHVFK